MGQLDLYGCSIAGASQGWRDEGHVPDVAGAMGKPHGGGRIVNSQRLPVRVIHGQAPRVGELGSPSACPWHMKRGDASGACPLPCADPVLGGRVLWGASRAGMMTA